MSKPQPITRPTFDEAIRSWKQLLAERKLPSELMWIFGDNLCFEPAQGGAPEFRLGFQTRFTPPPPPDSERIAYRYFLDFEAPLIFYRLGTNGGKSVCVLLCDDWFNGRTEAEGFRHKPEWHMAFRPGSPDPIEEITDAERWSKRLLRRPLHDLDFCMDLRAVHEILAHGRVLSTYEQYALRFLHVWRRIFEERGQFHQ